MTKAASKQAKVVRKEGKAVGKDVNKALRDAEKLVNKQTEKGEVNKYLLCIVDPELGWKYDMPNSKDFIFLIKHKFLCSNLNFFKIFNFMILNLGLHLNKSSPYLVIFSYLKKHLSLTVDKSLVIDLCQLFIFFFIASVSAPPGADILNKLRNPPTGKGIPASQLLFLQRWIRIPIVKN